MKHQILENSLKARIKKRRIIVIAIGILFLALAVFCLVRYEQSRVVKEIDYIFGIYQLVSYNYDWMWGCAGSGLVVMLAAIFLIVDLLFTKVSTIEVNTYHITLYRGWQHTNLYIDGDYKDGISLVGYYLEATLPDGTKVNVALGKWSAHITFSNGYPPVDL